MPPPTPRYRKMLTKFMAVSATKYPKPSYNKIFRSFEEVEMVVEALNLRR
jgi:hypothetical protein